MEPYMIQKAIEVATRAHQGQFWKTDQLPYITHPYSGGMILSRAQASEEVIVAGILHDVIEDTSMTKEDLIKEFNLGVATIVEGCSENKSLSWGARKFHSIEDLKYASFQICCVTLADKIHNLRSISASHERVGDEVWKAFKKGKEHQAKYYQGLVEVLGSRIDIYVDELVLFHDFRKEVDKLFS